MDKRLLYKIRVTGRVQGVGFRHSTVNEAKKLDLTGYVKNLADGSVYIEAEGLKEQLDALVEWCRTGPGMSSVESVSPDISAPAGHKEFRVKY